MQNERRVLTVIIILSAAAVAQSFGRFTWGVVLPEARDEMLGGSNSLAGLFGSINVSAYLVGTVVVAWLASHFTLVGLVRIGLVFSTSGIGLAAVTSSAWLLGAALALMGMGGAMIWVPAPGITARLFPDNRRGLAAGIVGTGIGVGIVFAGRLASGLSERNDDAVWQTVYRIEFMIAVLVLVLAFTVLKSHGERPSVAGGLGGFGALRRVDGWKPLTIAYSAYGFSYILVIAFMVTRLVDDSGYSAGRASLMFSIVGVAIIFGGLTVAPISDRVGRRPTLVVAFLVWAAASLLMLTGSLPLVVASSVAIGIMFSGVPSTIIAHVITHTDQSTYGPAFSATTLSFGAAQAISPQIGGAIAEWRGSFTSVFVLAAAMALVGSVAASRIPD